MLGLGQAQLDGVVDKGALAQPSRPLAIYGAIVNRLCGISLRVAYLRNRDTSNASRSLGMDVPTLDKNLRQHRIAIEPGGRPHFYLAPIATNERAAGTGNNAAFKFRRPFRRKLLQIWRRRAAAPGLGRRDVIATMQPAGDRADALGEARPEIVQELLVGADRQYRANCVDSDKAL